MIRLFKNTFRNITISDIRSAQQYMRKLLDSGYKSKLGNEDGWVVEFFSSSFLLYFVTFFISVFKTFLKCQTFILNIRNLLCHNVLKT